MWQGLSLCPLRGPPVTPHRGPLCPLTEVLLWPLKGVLCQGSSLVGLKFLRRDRFARFLFPSYLRAGQPPFQKADHRSKDGCCNVCTWTPGKSGSTGSGLLVPVCCVGWRAWLLSGILKPLCLTHTQLENWDQSQTFWPVKNGVITTKIIKGCTICWGHKGPRTHRALGNQEC